MIAGQALVDDALVKLAGSVATLNKMMGMENKVALVLDTWSEARDLDPAGLTIASFMGYATLLVGTGAQQVGYDTSVGLWFIELLPPAGGWYFEATGIPAPAQSVTGYIVTDNAGTTLYLANHLDTPVLIDRIGASVSLPPIRIYEDAL